MTSRKRVVLWGTGVVGSMVAAELVDHPASELVGVGVSNPAKVGRDVGEVCGLGREVGVLCTDSVEDLVALAPDALVHYGPTAQYADENIRVITAFLRAGIDVCSTAMTPWVWPAMRQTPSNWVAPIEEIDQESKQGKAKPSHTYTLEDYGLTEAGVRAAFDR